VSYSGIRVEPIVRALETALHTTPSPSLGKSRTQPESTYWYLTAVPELLGLAAHRLEDTFEADQ
jgi:hypothetical protein